MSFQEELGMAISALCRDVEGVDGGGGVAEGVERQLRG